MTLLTTKQTAELLNYTSDAVSRKLIQRGQLKAHKLGHVWVIPEEELGKVKRIRKPHKRKTS